MLPLILRITLGVGLIIYFVAILLFLKYKAIELKYTLIWIFCGLTMLLMIAFPDLLTFLLNLFGIAGTMNGLFILLIAFLLMISMSLTSIVSRQSSKIRILVQEISILSKKIQDLEEKFVNEKKLP